MTSTGVERTVILQGDDNPRSGQRQDGRALEIQRQGLRAS